MQLGRVSPYRPPHRAHSLSECEDLNSTAETVRTSKVPVLADGLDAGLQAVDDLQGALVIGRYYSGWNSIKNHAEIFVGLRDAPLFQQ
jgi:hypothetical protein